MKGELVCKNPFPSMPLKFWNDKNDTKFKNAYFNKFPNVWYHGDYAEIRKNGGFVIHGRSDTTLNPGGVRLGTAEIYSEVESFKEIKESIVVGQAWDNDIRIVLFIVLNSKYKLDDLSGNYFDANLTAYGQLLENNWHRASTLDPSQIKKILDVNSSF